MRPTPCISGFGYFSSPDFLIQTLHILSAISTPIYFLGVYCILFKTPKEMASAKFYMLNHHFWIMCLDYYMCIFTVPYLLVPEFAGITYGVLRHLGVPSLYQELVGAVMLAYMVIAIIAIYENRFFILCEFRGKATWAFARRIWLFANHAVMIVISIPVYFLLPDQETARQKIFNNLPCLPDYIYQEPVLVMTTGNAYYAATLIFACTILCVQPAFFILQLILNWRKQQTSQRISQKTLQLHKQFFLALVTQMSIPVSFLLVPLGYGYMTFLFNYYNQAVMNWVLVVFMSHGALSTVVMIVVHKPYRLSVKTMIWGSGKKFQRKITVLSIKSVGAS